MEVILGAAAAIGFAVVVLLLKTVYRVEEGHAAAVTSFGRPRVDAQGKLEVTGPGLNSKKPWEKVHQFSVMERSLSIREEKREVEILTRDGTLLRLNPQIRFQFRKELFPAFIFGMRHPTSHIRELFRSLLSTQVSKFGSPESEEGSYAEIRRNQSTLHAQLKSHFNEQGLDRKYGVLFKAAEITEILPPADLAQALNSVQKIEAENTTLLNRFRAECEQRIAAAEHAVQIATLKGEAVKSEIDILGQAVAEMKDNGILEAYLQRRRDEVTSNSKTLYFKA